MARFYNPGPEINEKLQYTHPTKDPREGNTLAYFMLSAPKEDYFEVPETITLTTDEGEVSLTTKFVKIVKSDYKVVLVNPAAKSVLDDDNTARNDREAKIKGDAMWKDYLKEVVSAHYTAVAEIRQGGGVPRSARGLASYALKVLNIADPADSVEAITRAQEGQVANAELISLIRGLQDKVSQLEGANGALIAMGAKT